MQYHQWRCINEPEKTESDREVPRGYVAVAQVSDILEGEGKMVVGLADKPIALFKVNGEFFAINHICPHRGGPLAEGKLRATIVTCPWHGWSFDIRTGEPEEPGGHSIAAYKTMVIGSSVCVGWLRRQFKK